MKLAVLVIVSCFLCLASSALELAGSYENDVLVGLKRGDEPLAGSLNRFRLKFDAKVGANSTIHLEPRYYTFIKSQDYSLTGATQLDQLIWDRVYLKSYFKLANITLGKQRIAWGTGYIWNPTDVSNPQTLSFAVGEEDETNVEAIRVEVPLGETSGIDAYVLTGSEWGSSRKGVRIKTNIEIFDYSVSHVDTGDSGFRLG
ncbi:hypothetical protein ACFL31_03785, partial [Candidatus Margulisiibacteriota bacterium]